MAQEYLVKGTSLTAIADEIRELSGTTGTMGLDAMATHIGDANTEVDNQVELLAQAVAALEGKAAGGGGSSTEEWICVNTLPTTFWVTVQDFYYEVPSNCNAILIKNFVPTDEVHAKYVVTYKNLDGCFINCEGTSINISDADETGTFIKITTPFPDYNYILPIFS